MRIKGEFVVMEGVVYKEYQDNIHAIDPFPNGIPDDWPKYRIIDYGASAPTACLWCVLTPREGIICYREHYERNRSIADNARMIITASGREEYKANYIDPCAYHMQPGMTETIAQQYQNAGIKSLYGWPTVNVMGEHAMVQKVKYRLENGEHYPLIQVFKTCTNLRREFRSWRYKSDKDGRPLASDAFDDTGPCHLLDCLKGFVATNPTHKSGWSVTVCYDDRRIDRRTRFGGYGP